MANERRKPKRSIVAFGLTVVAALALSGGIASSASAVSLEAPSFPMGIAVAKESGAFYTKMLNYGGINTVACKETTGSGSLSTGSAGTISLVFHGCEIPALSKCQSSGASSGTIVAEPMAINLAKLTEGASGEPGVVLHPTNSLGTIAAFTCYSGFITVKWSGGLIGSIEEPGYGGSGTNLNIKFAAGGSWESEQQYTQTYHGWSNKIMGTWNGQEGPVGLVGNVDLNLEQESTLRSEPEAGEQLRFTKYPKAVSVHSETGAEVALRGLASSNSVKCTTSGEVPAVSGKGEFSTSTSGTVTFMFQNCKETALGTYCTSTGQPKGTVVTESLPVQLTYLSDGKPGVVIKANASSGKVAEMLCTGGLVKYVVEGGGMLGSIVNPPYGHTANSLNVNVNAIQQGEEYVQEYAKTEHGEEFRLQKTVNGGAPQAVSLALKGWSFSPNFLEPGFQLGEF